MGIRRRLEETYSRIKIAFGRHGEKKLCLPFLALSLSQKALRIFKKLLAFLLNQQNPAPLSVEQALSERQQS